MAYNRISLWELTRDPQLVAFFKRGARDAGMEPALVGEPGPRWLDGGTTVDATQEERAIRRDAFQALSTDIGRGHRFAVRVLEDA